MKKHNYIKKTLKLVLVLAIFIAFLPITAEDVSAVSKSGTVADGDITWEVSGSGTLTLTFKGSGIIPEGSNDNWGYYKSKIEKIVIGEGITEIGGHASFMNYEALKSVQFPKSLVSIGERAFEGCTNLYDVTLHEGLKEIGDSAFQNTGLKKITIPSTLEFIVGYTNNTGTSVFADCTELSAITIKNGFKRIARSMFAGCTKLESVNIPSSVEAIGLSAFYNCSSLKSIVIPESVKSYGLAGGPGVMTSYIEGLFEGCISLVDVKILSNAGLPNSIFEGCTSLQKVVVPDGIKEIPMEAFRDCSSLKEIVLPDGLEKIDTNAFNNTAFKKLTIPASVTHVDYYAFFDAALTDVYYTGSKVEWEVLTEEHVADYNDPLLNAKVHFIGWTKDTKGWRYYTTETSYHKNTWKKIDGKWYHFDASGYIQTGWQKLSGKWYYFNGSGHMIHGWQKVDGKWYYFGNESDQDSGTMQTGWIKVGGEWYYMSGSGAMQTGWIQSGGAWYYLKSSGAMAANEYIGGYWLNGNGSWTYPHKATWRKSGNRWWYGDATGWYAKNGTYKIDGTVYKFDASGWMK